MQCGGVINVHNNSEVVGTYPTKALNASRRVGLRQARTIRCGPKATQSISTSTGTT